jgi:hypothetical protein
LYAVLHRDSIARVLAVHVVVGMESRRRPSIRGIGSVIAAIVHFLGVVAAVRETRTNRRSRVQENTFLLIF